MTIRTTFTAAAVSTLASAAALLLAPPSPATAAMPGTTVSITVRTADLDLSTARGQAQLAKRLEIAAAEACGDRSSADPTSRRTLRQCRADALEAGQRQAAAQIAEDRRLAAR